MPEIMYRAATKDDSDSILEFLREHFYPDEPLTNACKPPKQEVQDELFALSHLSREPATCFVALNGDQMVGVLIAGPKSADEERIILEEASRFPGSNWEKLLYFVAGVERGTNVFEKYKVDNCLHGHYLAVHKEFRCNGIAKKLIQISIAKAREQGYQIYTNDCSSVSAARLSEHLGFKCVYEVSVADFRIPGSDEQVFFPVDKDQVLKTYLQRL